MQVEVSFLRRVREVKAILVSLPENYRHDIQHKNQLLDALDGPKVDLSAWILAWILAVFSCFVKVFMCFLVS